MPIKGWEITSDVNTVNPNQQISTVDVQGKTEVKYCNSKSPLSKPVRACTVPRDRCEQNKIETTVLERLIWVNRANEISMAKENSYEPPMKNTPNIRLGYLTEEHEVKMIPSNQRKNACKISSGGNNIETVIYRPETKKSKLWTGLNKILSKCLWTATPKPFNQLLINNIQNTYCLLPSEVNAVMADESKEVSSINKNSSEAIFNEIKKINDKTIRQLYFQNKLIIPEVNSYYQKHHSDEYREVEYQSFINNENYDASENVKKNMENQIYQVIDEYTRSRQMRKNKNGESLPPVFYDSSSVVKLLNLMAEKTNKEIVNKSKVVTMAIKTNKKPINASDVITYSNTGVCKEIEFATENCEKAINYTEYKNLVEKLKEKISTLHWETDGKYLRIPDEREPWN